LIVLSTLQGPGQLGADRVPAQVGIGISCPVLRWRV